jgi:hypothetical protein
MFVRSNQSNLVEELVPLAETLADAFENAGDTSAADQVLDMVSRHRISDGVALRRAEHAFVAGDATGALDALVPAWEAGSGDQHLEIQMGLASLALGLYDVVETLTARDEFSLDHVVLRWLAAIIDGFEQPDLDWEHPQTVWSAAAMLKTLAQCGRTDVVFLAQAAAEALNAQLFQRAISSLPASEPILAQPASPPSNGRAAFKNDWQLPGGDVVFNWVWSSARQAFTGERILVVGPDAHQLKRFTEHGITDIVTDCASDRSHTSSEPRIRPGRYEHIISVFDVNRSLAPGDVFRDYARALTHEGQLHLLVAGQNMDVSFDLGLSRRAVERLCDGAALKLIGMDSRDESGLPTEPSEAAVHLLRAEKRVF